MTAPEPLDPPLADRLHRLATWADHVDPALAAVAARVIDRCALDLSALCAQSPDPLVERLRVGRTVASAAEEPAAVAGLAAVVGGRLEHDDAANEAGDSSDPDGQEDDEHGGDHAHLVPGSGQQQNCGHASAGVDR